MNEKFQFQAEKELNGETKDEFESGCFEQKERVNPFNLMIVRHGETQYNAENRFQGNTDVALTKHGQEQAKAAGEKLKLEGGDIVYAGPLERQRETAEIALGNNFIIDKRLHEISAGDAEGHTRDELPGKVVEEIIANNFFDYSIVGGESKEEVSRRIDDFISELSFKHPEETVIIVTSAGVARWIAMHYGNNPNLEIPTGGIAEIVIEPTKKSTTP